MELLIAVYSDINAKDMTFDSTALHCAAKCGQARIVLLLLSSGASVKSRENSNMTPLLLAAKNGYLAGVKYLLEGGSSVDDFGGSWTRGRPYLRASLPPLMCAAANGHTEVVDLLFDYDKKSHRIVKPGLTAVLLAAYNGYIEILERFFDRGAKNTISSWGWNGIHFADQNDHDDCVEFLASDWISLSMPFRTGTMGRELHFTLQLH